MTPANSRMSLRWQRLAIAAMATCLACASVAHAQWLKYKTPGIPRTADGKPNLTAPAPRMADGKPDFSGLWRVDTAGMAETGKAEDTVKLQPWAEALTAKRKENLGNDAPSVMCLPFGPVVDIGVGKVLQTPRELVMLWNGTLYREIFLDGRPLPEDPNPTWMGYSVGHWEGKTLVIMSAGFNDRTWLDDDGRPHTEALRVTERLTRKDFGHMEIIRTFDDPGAFVQPWTVPVKLELNADTEPLEYVCNENEKDRQHLVGKASDEKSVAVAPSILATYAGSYEFTIPTTGQVMKLTFDPRRRSFGSQWRGTDTVSDRDLGYGVRGAGVTMKFGKNESGAVTYVLMQAVEGDFKAIRK